MMFADRDYERTSIIKTSGECSSAVSVQNYLEKGYYVVNIQCKDRPNLLFYVVFTQSDMQYTVFHARIETTENGAYLVHFHT
ncbi:putative ACT domain-containing protein ACR1-12 [Helianthus anomalus]